MAGVPEVCAPFASCCFRRLSGSVNAICGSGEASTCFSIAPTDDERTRPGHRRLQCTGCGRHRAASDYHARSNIYGLGSLTTTHIAKEAQAVLCTDVFEAVPHRGYFNGEEILACDEAGITVTLTKPMTSGAKAEGRFGKQDFVYLADENVYRCPAGGKLKYRYTTEEHGQTLHRYWADARRTCPSKNQCTRGRERCITRWEHEEIVEAVQESFDKNPDAMRTRRETVARKNIARKPRGTTLHCNRGRLRTLLPRFHTAKTPSRHQAFPSREPFFAATMEAWIER